MEFRILGSLEVGTDAGPVTPAGAKPRALLAMLLLHANEPVSAERLAIGLWGEDAPARAAKTIQVHVSRLRRALGEPDIQALGARAVEGRSDELPDWCRLRSERYDHG